MATFGMIIGAMFFGALLCFIGFIIGVAVTQANQKDAQEERELLREHTMHLVYRGMMDAGIGKDQALDAVNNMKTRGILFREKETDATRVDAHS